MKLLFFSALLVIGLTRITAAQSSTQAALSLIPLPREIQRADASVLLPGTVTIVTGANPDDRDAATLVIDALAERGVTARANNAGAWKVELLRVGEAAATSALRSAGTVFTDSMRPEGYVLRVHANGAQVIAASSAGIFYGLQSFLQLVEYTPRGRAVRQVVLRDWPAMKWRGVHDDLSRGPIPTLEYQKRQIRLAAQYKINVWSPYYEQSLEYESHPLVAPPGGAMSQADVRELVAYAKRHHITIVPEQEAFGHLHHLLKNEMYSGIGETPHGHVLAPGDPRSATVIRDMFTEIARLFPGPFIHLGADETDELGRGRTKARVDSVGLGPVYLGFLRDVVSIAKPFTGDRRFLFWGDIAEGSPALVKTLPADMIAVAWAYGANEGFDRKLKPYRDAGMETWSAPGVSSWKRVYPHYGNALANIRNFARVAQAGGSTGLLNTIWDDDGDAIFEQTWYGVLFGAAAAWQPGESNIERFQNSYGRVFHGDTTGAIDAAQREMIAAYASLGRGRVGDETTAIFFADPWSAGDDSIAARLRPVLGEIRIHAESALVLIAKARRQAHLREKPAVDALELGARRMDWLAAKFQFADAIVTAFDSAAVDSVRARRVLQNLTGMNGVFQDMRDGFALTRDLFEQAWKYENRPYWMTNALARFDAELQRWVERGIDFDQAMRRWSRERRMPRREDVGIPPRRITQ